jgi:hypothetical protein
MPKNNNEPLGVRNVVRAIEGDGAGEQNKGTQKCYFTVKVADPVPVAPDSSSVTVKSNLYCPSASSVKISYHT